jgi:pimeloyl-ACP methyl ester carboxylesterase
MNLLFWIALLTIAIVLAILVWISFAHWKKAALARLRDGAQVIFTSLGPIECAVLGEGPAVLISHGALGGYDQGLAAITSGFFGGGSYRFIAVSRPGYLRTPPEVGKTPEEQADAFAALLDALKVEKAIVAGISAGGPPSLQFALRHPERCAALLLISAVTERIPVPEPKSAGPFLRAIMQADFLAWLMLGLARRFPRVFFRPILSREELRRIHEPRVHMNLLRIIDSTAPISARWLGLMIDGNYLTTFVALPLASISVPTLALHGTSDTIVPFASSKRTAAAIPGARLVSIENGSHFACVLVLEELGTEVSKFLERAVW